MINNLITYIYDIYINSNIENGLANTSNEYKSLRKKLIIYECECNNKKTCDSLLNLDKLITSSLLINNEDEFKLKLNNILLEFDNINFFFNLVNIKQNKKKTIPAVIKKIVWNTYIGDNIGKTKCLCCKTIDITQHNFSCGHIISEYNGGQIEINNLKPICSSCNLSMGTTNMNDFINLYFPNM